MTCLMLGFKNQVIGNYYGMVVHVYFHELIFLLSDGVITQNGFLTFCLNSNYCCN